jgi:zinc transporter ZupT
VIGIFLASRLLSVDLPKLAAAMVAPLLATAGMVAVVAGVVALLDSPWPTLALAAIAGAGVYLGLLWALVPDALRDLRDKLRRPEAPPPPDSPLLRDTDFVT